MRIKDFRTSNGTFVNDEQIEVDKLKLLNVGDKIRLAYDQITFTVSKKDDVVKPNSPSRGSDLPCVLSDPEKTMASALCEFTDSIIDLDTAIELNEDPTVTNQDHEIVEEPDLKYDDLGSEKQQEYTSDYFVEEAPKVIEQSIPLSKVSETFTIDFEARNDNESGSVSVSHFVPSKLRASFEERERTKRTKMQPSKMNNKEEKSLPKNVKPSGVTKITSKISIINSRQSSVSLGSNNLKNEDKNSPKAVNAPKKTKVNEKPSKSKTVFGQRKQSLDRKESVEKVQSLPASKISTPTLTKKNSRSHLLDKLEDSANNKRNKEINASSTSPFSKVSFPGFTTKISKSYILDKFSEDSSSDKSDSFKINIKPPKISTSKKNVKKVKSYALENIPTSQKNEQIDKSPKSYILPKYSELDDSTSERSDSIKMTAKPLKISTSQKHVKKVKPYALERSLVENIPTSQTNEQSQSFSSSTINFPTLSKKNSKSYLLEKMLLGDNSSHDFLTYEKEQMAILNEALAKLDSTDLDVNSDIKGSLGNLSEAATYIIEQSPDGKTVDIEDSDHTLGHEDSSSLSSFHLQSKTELESKSTGKWLSEFPNDDVIVNCDNKNKRTINSKFTGSSMPHIPNDEYFLSGKRDNFREDDHYKSNYNCLGTDIRQRGSRNTSNKSIEDDNNNIRNSTLETQHDHNSNLQNAYSSYSNITYGMGNQSNIVAEDFYVPDDSTQSTVPNNSCKQMQHMQHKTMDLDNFSSTQVNIKHYPRSTFSVASLDTALLLQDTEALLNDMEKRVYSRKDRKDEMSKSQCFSTNMTFGDKIPFVDEADEKEDSSLFSYPNEVEENIRMTSTKPVQALSYNDPIPVEEKNRSYTVRSPINSGSIRRNNSCKLGISESMIISRKLNTSIRNQRSCSMIEEKRLNNMSSNNNNATNINNNNNNESSTDYRSKSKPSVLAMNSGIYLNRRGSAGISSALNSPVSRFEPSSLFNNSFSVQKSKEFLPYFSTNMLSLHRQRFNRYEYGQHSLKYNSNSTTMLYNKYNNTSPPWNGEDTVVSPNSFYPTYDTDYYPYSAVPESFDTNHDHNNVNNNSQIHTSNVDLNPDTDFNKREDIGEFSQHCNASGRSSAFSPVNSLHQSTESVNNYQMASKSRSSIGLNEQRQLNYDILLVSSVHQYSARLCRYTEEIVHRMSRREGSDYQGNSPDDAVFDQSDSFGQLKSVNRELQETVSNLRSLEKQLQKIERFVFPTEKSGRNSTAGSCTEDNYLNQLERINKELKDFVPINDTMSNKVLNAKLTVKGEYCYLPSAPDTKESTQVNFKSTPSNDKNISISLNNDTQSKAIYNNSVEVRSNSKSKYSSISKRFQHRKD